MSSVLSLDILRNYVRAKLGRGSVRIELTDEQIDAAVTDAMEKFNEFVPLRGRRMLSHTAGGRYVLSDDVPQIQEVIDVRGVRDRTATESVGVNEKQRVTKTTGASGTFTLGYNGTSSSAISTSATATAVQNALRSIPALANNVIVSGPMGGPWVVEFVSQLASRDVPALTVESQPDTGTISVAVLNNGSARDNSSNAYDRMDLFDPLVYLSGAAPAVSGLAAYWQSLEMLEQARRVFSADVEWHGGWEYDEDREERVYALYVQVGQLNRMQYGYEYLIALTPDDNARTGLAYVPHGMQAWFRAYVLAQSKLTLGRIRGKFQGIPSPEGADMQLDGIELATEAQNEILRLEEQIKNKRVTFPPIVG